MSEVEELEARIRNLPGEELAKFRDWFHQFEDVNKIPQMNLTILNLMLEIVKASAEVLKDEGLLTNDSFVVAFMHEQGLTKLATANGDFDG
jgi:predicted nucleic acid-binding protein